MERSYKNLRKKAILLRENGLSYNEIKKELGISKSTLSYWLKTVELKPEHRERLYTKQIKYLSFGSKSQRERRSIEVDKIIQAAIQEVNQPLSIDTYRLMGACLYWAEGGKGGMFKMTNSDPHVILFMTKWLEKVFDIPPSVVKAWLNIYPQQNELEIKSFWSELTKIPMKNFGKSYVKPFSTGYKKNNLYYGTMRIEVPKSTDMKHRIFGWVKGALVDIEPETELVQRRWQRLTGVIRPSNL
jgi:hypothetical protein